MVVVALFGTGKNHRLGRNLLVSEGSNTGEDLALHELEGGSATGGDVGHVTGTAGLLAGGDGVTTTDDGDGTLLLGEVGKDVNNAEGSLGELLDLEDAHGSVHDDGLAVGEELLLLLGGLGTVVKAHPAIGDGIGGDGLGVGIGGELVSDNDVGGEEDGLAKLLGLLHDSLGGVNEVVLNKGGTNVEALGLEEGENHASADDDLVALLEEGLKDGDLGGDLGSTDDGGHGLLAAGDGTIEVLDLLGEEVAGDGGGEELGHTLSGGVGTVGGTEGIVDEEVEGSGELLDEGLLVLGLLLVEAGVLEHEDISLLGGIDHGLDLVTDAVGGELDVLAEELSHALGGGAEGELVLGTIGAAQVGADGDDGALGLEVLDGGDGGTDAGVIGDLLAVKGDVDVATDKDLLALELIVGEVLDGLLGLELKVGGCDGSADANLGCNSYVVGVQRHRLQCNGAADK